MDIQYTAVKLLYRNGMLKLFVFSITEEMALTDTCGIARKNRLQQLSTVTLAAWRAPGSGQ
jgi:hypothetical protein